MSSVLSNRLRKESMQAAVAMDAVKDQPMVDLAQFVDAEADARGVLAITNWSEDDDQLEGMSTLDQFDGHMFAAFDLDGDGEVSEEELVYQERIIAAAGDFMLSNGILADDIDILLGYDPEDETEVDDATTVADRVRDALKQSLPSEEGAVDNLANDFVFDQDKAVAMDAASSRRFAKTDASGKKFQYRRVKSVRNGKLVMAAKRITAGAFKLSPKAKAHLKRLASKAWSSARKAKLVKSMRIRKNRGL